MSNALAIAGVTGVLQYLLNQVYNHPSSVLGTVTVSAVAPDIVQALVGSGTNAPLQVNVFLHQVTLNSAWRNMNLPSLSPDGVTVWNNPPLALDLHYLLTAYAPGDGQAEALLGFAMFLIHQAPALSRAQVQAGLAGLPPTYASGFASGLAACGLAEQVEMLTITPATLGKEEIAWLWTALKADYRPSFPFRVSVVLIDPAQPVVAALPVLSRNISAQAGLAVAFPTLTALSPPNGQPAAVLGDSILVTGSNLSGVTGVALVNTALGISVTLPTVASPAGGGFSFTLPSPNLPAPQPNPTDLPAGVYTVQAIVAGPTAGATIQTNTLPLMIAAKIPATWAPGTIAAGQAVTVQVPCTPYLRVGQQVSLIVGSQSAMAEAYKSPTNTPLFLFASLSATGQPVPVRLRVDGIDSPILDLTKTPPVFAGPSVEVK